MNTCIDPCEFVLAITGGGKDETVERRNKETNRDLSSGNIITITHILKAYLINSLSFPRGIYLTMGRMNFN